MSATDGPETDAVQRLDLNTSALQPEARLSTFREICAELFPVDFTAPEPDRFNCRFSIQRTEKLVGYQIETSALQARVEKVRAARKDMDSVSIQFIAQGGVAGIQGGRELSVGPKSAVFFPDNVTGSVLYGEGTALQGISLDRSLLRPLVGEDMLKDAVALNGPTPALVLLRTWLAEWPRIEQSGDSMLVGTFTSHTVDLVALLLGASDENRDLIEMRGVKAARLQAILGHIASSAARPSFSGADVARALSISERYLRLLLEETGKTFSEHLLEHRLQLTLRLLTDQRNAGRKVSEIAMRAGFSDISYFNRAFRRRFGDTPTGVRLGKPTGC